MQGIFIPTILYNIYDRCPKRWFPSAVNCCMAPKYLYTIDVGLLAKTKKSKNLNFQDFQILKNLKDLNIGFLNGSGQPCIKEQALKLYKGLGVQERSTRLNATNNGITPEINFVKMPSIFNIHALYTQAYTSILS